MHRLFQLRHLATLAGVIGVGVIPLQACHLELGGAANYALLGGGLTALGSSTVTVTSTGIGTNQGTIGSRLYLGASNFVTSGSRTTLPTSATAPYTAAQSAADTLRAVAASEGINLTAPSSLITNLNTVTSPLGTGILGPGVYYFTNDTLLPANSTLTLSGKGEYVFVLAPQGLATGTLTFGQNSTVVLADGANPANISWVANGAIVSSGVTVQGQILTNTGVAVTSATIQGRILGTRTTSAHTFFGSSNLIQTGLPPHTSVTGVALNGGSVSGDGTAANPYFISQGQALTYTVTGTDPDAGVVTLESTGDETLSGYSEVISQNGSTTAQVTYTPPVDVPVPASPVAITYTSTDAEGAVCLETIYIHVNALPVAAQLANVAGEAPFFQGRAGTVAEPLVACIGEPVSFEVSFTDPDFVGEDQTGTNSTSLDVTGDTGSFSFDPVLPTTNPAGTVGTTATFTPSAGDAGTTRIVTFTATDEFGAANTQTVAVYTAALPAFTSPASQALEVCVGQPLQYTVTATDATTGIPGSDVVPTLELSVAGTPEGATHTPNAPDSLGALEVTGDVLVFAGDPSGTSSTFNWTPQAGEEGTYNLTYTATNVAGCSTEYNVAIKVTAVPTVSITGVAGGVGGTGTEVDPYLVRLENTTPFSFTVTGTSTLVEDTVTLAATGTPAGATFDPTGANPAQGTFSFLATAEQVNTIYPVTFTATSQLEPNCPTTQTVYLRVVSTGVPTSITLVRSGGAVFGEQVCYTATVFDNTPDDLGGPQPLPGVQVCFDVQGTTGNNGQFLAITNESGEAVYCLTPVFPGTLDVTAVIDQNGDCVADNGTTVGSDSTTVPAPIPGGTATYVNGQGKVAVLPATFAGAAVAAEFSLDISPKANGTYKGKINVLIPGAGVNKKGRRTNVKLTSTRILSVTSSEVPGGRAAVILGVAKITGVSESGLNGTVTFRADVFDGGTPGIGNDHFTITLLNSETGQAVGPIGGELSFGRPNNNGRGSKDDIKIRTGVTTRSPQAS